MLFDVKPLQISFINAAFHALQRARFSFFKKKKRGNGHKREQEVQLQPLPILGLKVGGSVGQVVEKVGSK